MSNKSDDVAQLTDQILGEIAAGANDSKAHQIGVLRQQLLCGMDAISAFREALTVDFDTTQKIGQMVVIRSNEFLQDELERLRKLKVANSLTDEDREYGSVLLPRLVGAIAELGAICGGLNHQQEGTDES